MTATLHAARRRDFDLSVIPLRIRAEARELDDLLNSGGRPGRYGGWIRPEEDYPEEADRVGVLLGQVSELLLGDRDALGETRDALIPGISEAEALDVVCNFPDAADLPRWLAAAAQYAAGCE